MIDALGFGLNGRLMLSARAFERVRTSKIMPVTRSNGSRPLKSATQMPLSLALFARLLRMFRAATVKMVSAHGCVGVNHVTVLDCLEERI